MSHSPESSPVFKEENVEHQQFSQIDMNEFATDVIWPWFA